MTTEHVRISRRVRALGALTSTSGRAGLYLLHFDPPFKHARHYLGFVGTFAGVDRRVAEHLAGRGSRLVKAALAAGSAARLVWSMAVPLSRARTLERRLKNTGSGTRLCPVCAPAERAKRAAARQRQRAAKKATPASPNATLAPVSSTPEAAL